MLPTEIDLESQVTSNVSLFATSGDKAMVHNGFLTAYLGVRAALLSQLRAIIRNPGLSGGWTLYITGHSLGGALATIFAYDVCTSGTKGGGEKSAGISSVVVHSFGSPRVGNKAFAEAFESRIDSSWRFSNVSDIIPTVPRFLGYR